MSAFIIMTNQNVTFDVLFSSPEEVAKTWKLWKKKKNWFELHYNDKIDHEYGIKVCDERRKNRKEVDQPLNSAIMLENKMDRQCLVKSWKMYLTHLHQDNEYLWQTPNLNPKNRNNDVWYTR